jgi:hypothetical protein
MPALAFMYAVFLSVGILWGCYTNVQNREPGWRIGIALFEGTAMLLLFVGYWVQPLVRPLGVLAPALFLFSIAWTLYHTRILLPKTNLRGRSRKAVIGTMAITNFPAYWFGGLAAWRAVS